MPHWFHATVLSVVVLPGASSLPAARVEVYLIAGQSNATGQGYVRNLPPGFVVPRGVELFHSGPPHLRPGTPALTWQPLAPASESPDRFGVELGLGRRLRELRPDAHLAFIKHAHSGTDLHTQWRPGTGAADRADWGPQFRIFVATVDAGLAALRARGDEPVLCGLYWHQGEADASSADPAIATAYAANLAHFFARVREQFHAPDLPIAFALITPEPAHGPGRQLVRQAQRDVDQASGRPVAVPGAVLIETDDLPRRRDDPASPYPHDEEHLGTIGLLRAGARAAEIFHRAQQRLHPRASP